MATRMQQIKVEPLRAVDRDAVHRLLRSHNLPLDGFDDERVIRLAARDGDKIVGSAAVEVHGRYGVLRSVAVSEDYRGRTLGKWLTHEALATARRQGLFAIYLLTETAAKFFPKFGFVPVPRTAIPEEVTQSVEFTSACPASAQAFVLRL